MKALVWLLAGTIIAGIEVHAVQIDCDRLYECPSEYEPVCGSDGVTYPNECEFEKAYCETLDEALFIMSRHACVKYDEDEVNESTPSITTPLQAQNEGNAFCNMNCKEDKDLVCGTDQVTYINDCYLLAAKCESPSVDKAYHGPCDNPTWPPHISHPGTAPPAIFNNDAKAEPVGSSYNPATLSPLATIVDDGSVFCNMKCKTERDFVCGSNGITYLNDCHLLAAKCGTPDVDKAYHGPCNNPTWPPEISHPNTPSPASLANEEEPTDGSYNDLSTSLPSKPIDEGNVFCNMNCKTEEDFVCGTDGITYLNDCHLLAAKCGSPDVEKAYHGPCDNPKDQSEASFTETTASVMIDKDEFAGSYYNPSLPEKSDDNSVFCNMECNSNEDLVCGTDQVTYLNDCHLLAAKCKNPAVDKDHHGPCIKSSYENMNSIEPSYDPPAATVPEITIDVGSVFCNMDCKTEQDFVCGTDGITYLNDCYLLAAKCESPTVDKAYHGPCDNPTWPPSIAYPGTIPPAPTPYAAEESPIDSQYQTINIISPPTIVDDGDVFCNMECKTDEDFVCGTDGATYLNDCHLLKAKCGNPNVDKAYHGSCDNPTWPPEVSHPGTAPSSTNGDEELYSPPTASLPAISDDSNAFCNMNCKSDVDLVCGTDGVTYTNDCHLLAAKCNTPNIDKAYHGACDDQTGSFELYHLLTTSAPEIVELTATASIERKCSPLCERVYDPVCGSNGVTYANPCLLEYANCENPSVVKLLDGKCPSHIGVRGSSTNPRSTGCVPDVCPSIEAPVCGSDGHSYVNICMFSNAQCIQPDLRLLHTGECGDSTILSCSTMTCPAFSECREEEGTGIAYCADVCSPERCSEYEVCQLLEETCFTAPCAPIATCVPIDVEE